MLHLLDAQVGIGAFFVPRRFHRISFAVNLHLSLRGLLLRLDLQHLGVGLRLLRLRGLLLKLAHRRLKTPFQLLASLKAAHAKHQHLRQQRRQCGRLHSCRNRLLQELSRCLQKLNATCLLRFFVSLDRAVGFDVNAECSSSVIAQQGFDLLPRRRVHQLLQLVWRKARRWRHSLLLHHLQLLLLLRREHPHAADLADRLQREMLGNDDGGDAHQLAHKALNLGLAVAQS